jgi:hypothetical protein
MVRLHRGLRIFGVPTLLAAAVLVASAAALAGPRKAGGTTPQKASARAAVPVEVPLTSVRVVEEYSGGSTREDTVPFGGQNYARALRMGGSDVAWSEFYLGKHYGRFQTLIGVSDLATGERKPLIYLVFGDGKELYRSPPLTVGDAPRPIDLDVSGVLRLRLEARREAGYWIRDHQSAFWVNPRLSPSGTPVRRTQATVVLDGNPLATPVPLVNGEPCLPLSLLRGLKGQIPALDWDEARGEVVITTR